MPTVERFLYKSSISSHHRGPVGMRQYTQAKTRFQTEEHLKTKEEKKRIQNTKCRLYKTAHHLFTTCHKFLAVVCIVLKFGGVFFSRAYCSFLLMFSDNKKRNKAELGIFFKCDSSEAYWNRAFVPLLKSLLTDAVHQSKRLGLTIFETAQIIRNAEQNDNTLTQIVQTVAPDGIDWHQSCECLHVRTNYCLKIPTKRTFLP